MTTQAPLGDLVSGFEALQTEKNPVRIAFLRSAATALGPEGFARLANSPLMKAGMDLAERANADRANPYHNATHTAEAVLSAGVLAREEFKGHPDRERMVLRAIVTMAGHDIGHDGTGNTPAKILEETSARITDEALAKRGASEIDRAMIRSAIMGTDPSKIPSNRQTTAGLPGAKATASTSGAPPESFERTAPGAVLRSIANDADLAASVLHETGVERGERLAAEWKRAGFPDSQVKGASSWAGRVAFLQYGEPASPAAEKIGLKANWAAQLAAFEKIGRDSMASQGLDASKSSAADLRAAGGRAMDAMEPELAKRTMTASVEQALAEGPKAGAGLADKRADSRNGVGRLYGAAGATAAAGAGMGVLGLAGAWQRVNEARLLQDQGHESQARVAYAKAGIDASGAVAGTVASMASVGNLASKVAGRAILPLAAISAVGEVGLGVTRTNDAIRAGEDKVQARRFTTAGGVRAVSTMAAFAGAGVVGTAVAGAAAAVALPVVAVGLAAVAGIAVAGGIGYAGHSVAGMIEKKSSIAETLAQRRAGSAAENEVQSVMAP